MRKYEVRKKNVGCWILDVEFIIVTDFTDFIEKLTANFAKVCAKNTKEFATDYIENRGYFTVKEYLL